MSALVDINTDAGESFGAYTKGEDAIVFPWVTSASVACGFHAGDPRVMAEAVRTAARHAVAIGAHPGFPDRVGFGRRSMSLSPEEAYTDTLYQIGALSAIARAAGIELQHVKPHGQLNNLAVADRALADAIVRAVRDFDLSLIVIACAGELARAAEAAGLLVAFEVYADREYQPNGSLVPRAEPGAVIHDVDTIVRRAVAMVLTGTVTAIDGATVAVRADTICVHGDTPGAGSIAQALRTGLEAEGCLVRPLREVLRSRT